MWAIITPHMCQQHEEACKNGIESLCSQQHEEGRNNKKCKALIKFFIVLWAVLLFHYVLFSSIINALFLLHIFCSIICAWYNIQKCLLKLLHKTNYNGRISCCIFWQDVGARAKVFVSITMLMIVSQDIIVARLFFLACRN